MVKLIKENIPEVLKNRSQWVGFKITEEGKKIPINPKTQFTGASISDPETWGTFEQACDLVENQKCVSVGYAITKKDSLIFMDLDCHTEGVAEDEKEKLVKFYKSLCTSASYIRTYQETSLSGNGKVFIVSRSRL